MKTVAVFGGSFNPPHDGHFEMGAYLHRTLKCDEVWMMFSVNRLKDPSVYAPLHHRMEMGRIMARHYPDTPFVMTDIEEKIATHQTYFLLKALRDQFPDHRFIWVMGADNLKNFDKWIKGDDIFREFPVAIVDRPGYTDEARNSQTLKKFSGLKQSDASGLQSGWVFLNSPGINTSSTHLMKQLRAGITKFDGHFQDVADYIGQHHLYNLTSATRITPGTPTP